MPALAASLLEVDEAIAGEDTDMETDASMDERGVVDAGVEGSSVLEQPTSDMVHETHMNTAAST